MSQVVVENGRVQIAGQEQLTIGLVDSDGNVVRRPKATAEKSVSDDEDLRPKGEVNADALRGIADRASEPTPIKRSTQPPASLN